MVEAGHGVIEGQAGIAAQPEDVLYTIQLKHSDHGFSAVHLRHSRSLQVSVEQAI
ncbi:hypothetical protein D3C80_2025270 [compost metagenome]